MSRRTAYILFFVLLIGALSGTVIFHLSTAAAARAPILESCINGASSILSLELTADPRFPATGEPFLRISEANAVWSLKLAVPGTIINPPFPILIESATSVWNIRLEPMEPPTSTRVSTDDATSVTTTSAVLNGNLTSLGSSTNVTVSFLWGLTENYTYETALITTNATGSFSTNISGLSPATLYHFRAKAVGDLTGYGADRTFTTLPVPPAVATDNATAMTATTARLNGTLNSPGTATNVTVSFQWGLSTNYTGGETAAISMNATGSFAFTLTGLSPERTYHFRARAIGHGTSYGSDVSFTTPPLPPTVATDNATDVSGRSAFLNGTLTSWGSSSNITLNFEWGLTTNYTHETATLTAAGTGPFSAYLTGLSENTTYHFRAKAAGASTAYGGNMSFTTEVLTGIRIEGLTYEAKGTPLSGVTITLDGASSNASDSNGIYRVTANTTGSHTVVASKTGFRNLTQTIYVTDIVATYTVDFKGDSGLVPNAPDVSYVLACINRWKFPPADGTGLSLSKVLQVVNAWKFPL